MISGKDFAEKYFSQSEENEKLFSTGNDELDDILEEVYYSGIEDGYDYAQKEFSSKKKVWDVEDDDDDEEKKNERRQRANSRKGRELQNSHRGLGRSLILGGTIPGAIGAYTTKSDADKDYAEGYSEDEIVKRAGKRGAKRGALLGAGVGTLAGITSAARHAVAAKRLGVKPNALAVAGNAALGIAGTAGMGALGAHLGAKKNAKTRLEKSRKKDD